MTNTSATGGYLQPIAYPSPTPLEDDALDDFLQAIVVGIVGLAGAFVFPRWQITPPNIPNNGVNWASIGVVNIEADEFAYEAHDPVIQPNPIPALPSPAPTYPNGTDITIRHEIMEIVCSFYGSNARANASLLRDGFGVAQNREVLQLAGMGFVGCGDITQVPPLINSQWYKRVDIKFRMRREVVRNYPILDIVSIPVTIKNDQGFSETQNITP